MLGCVPFHSRRPTPSPPEWRRPKVTSLTQVVLAALRATWSARFAVLQPADSLAADLLARMDQEGDYRIICRIEDDRLCVLVVAVGNRREVYR